MKKFAIVGVLVIVVVVAALIARDKYFHDKPLDMADDYHEDAAPAAAQITASMDKVYDSFDSYLLASTFPKDEFKNVDNVDEFKRRLVPILDDSDAAIRFAQSKISTAEKTIKRERADLLETPSAKFLENADPIEETEDVADQTRDYLKRVDRYVSSYDKYLDYEKDDVDLRRRELQVQVQNDVPASASLETFTDSLNSQLEETKSLLKAREDLEPVRDTEDLSDNAVEYLNVTIDYLEQTQEAFDALDIDGLKAADADYIDEIRGVGKEESKLIAKLGSKSGLSEAARSLSDRADKLQDAVDDVGTGPARDEAKRNRKPIFAPPGSKPKGGDKGGPDDQQS